MNKVIKGAVAAGAATVLLVGGAGTFAFWSDQATVAGGTLTSGFLSLDVTNATWTDITHTAPGPFDPATDTIVPGDVIRYTANAVVDGDGKNLEATLEADTSGIGGDLAPFIDITFTVGGVSSPTPELSYDLGPVSGSETYPIVMVFTFDPNATFADGMNSDLNLADFELTLTQNTNP